jgi:hypothetical protein
VSSLYADSAVYDERRAGASLGISPKWATFRMSYETGANRYLAPTIQPDGSSVTRNDDVKTFSGGIRGHIGRLLTLGIEVTQDEYTSNIPGFDRSILRIGTTVGFGESGRIEILR